MNKYTTHLIALALVLFAGAPIAIQLAPYESTMGLVQKIFYYHVPGAILMLLLAMFGGVTSAIYLFKKAAWADHWSIAAAEQVVLFGTMTLVTGPLWGRKAWGVYWDWDVRQTSALLLWLTFVSYLLLRRFGGPGSDKLAAGVALFGLANSPFVYVSVNYWRTLHPQTTVVPTLPVSMGAPLWFCFTALLLFFLVMMSVRTRLERQRARLEAFYLSEDDQ